jgi:vitamin B12 transporter
MVVDRAGKAVEYATVSAPALRLGAVTDAAGRFTLDLPAGAVTIEASQIGYQRARALVTVAAGFQALRLVLAEEPVPVAEVVVGASSYGRAGRHEGAVLRRREIVMTPGGTADVFQSLRALPGINAPDEGAALYVRGGDPSETLVRLDGGTIGHPYHYEGASGGLFSAFDAYMLKSASFSSGGFGARTGGVLSGVLDIDTVDPLGLRTVSVGANMVGGGVSTSWALVPDKLSLIGTARFSAVDLLQRLYGSARDYVSAPASRDAAARLLYRYSPAGRLSLLYLGAGDEVDLYVTRLNHRGRFDQRSRNHFVGLQLQDVVAGSVVVRANAGLQRYHTRWNLAPYAMDERERNLHANLDAVWMASPRHEVSFGAGVRSPGDRIEGFAAADSTRYGGAAPTRMISTDARVTSPGVYLEDKVRLWGPLYATLGARADRASTPGVWTADPRAALAWRIDDRQTLRLATGRYHQLPDASRLDPVYGNPALAPMRADHVIAGYEWRTGDETVRLEAYRKDYRGLVTTDSLTWYANGGHGYARGVDALVQGALGRLSGWVSYGWLDSKRKENDDPREVTAAYGVTHSATVVGMMQVTPEWQVGARYGYATGRPYTPVTGRAYDAAAGVWRPVYGEHHSARLPDHHRLDVRLTKLFSLPAGLGLPGSNVCVFYVEALNVLGTRNVLDYGWSEDYTERHATLSYFSRRMAVAGFGFTW